MLFSKYTFRKKCKNCHFFPHSVDFPKVTTDDLLRQVTTDIVKLLTVPLQKIGPILGVGDDARNALLKVARLLNRADSIPKSLPSPSDETTLPPRVQLSNTHSVSPPKVKVSEYSTVHNNIR